MGSIYKTIFVDAHKGKKTSVWKPPTLIDGPQLARDVQAAIVELEMEGYRLFKMESVMGNVMHGGAHKSKTEGMLLVFELVDFD